MFASVTALCKSSLAVINNITNIPMNEFPIYEFTSSHLLCLLKRDLAPNSF